MSGTNGHNRGQVIDESVEADRQYAATSSPFHATVAEAQREENEAHAAAAEARKVADDRWSELEEITARVAAGREALAQSAARGPTKPLAKVLKFFEGKTTPAEDLDTARRTCEIGEDESLKLVLADTDATERRVEAERQLEHDTWQRFRAVTSRRLESMRPLIDGCGPTSAPGSDLPSLITPNSDNWVAWTQQNVYIGGSDREAALDRLNKILTEDSTHAT